jgi:phosphoglycerate dehydrogenase-like enzyme/quinol monooxygenase YgiN
MPAGTEAVVLLVELTIAEGGIDRFLALTHEHARSTRQDVPGCLRFDVVRENDAHVVIYEVYADRAALAASRSRPELERYRERTMALVTERRVQELHRWSADTPARRSKVLCTIPVLAERRHLVQRLVDAGYDVAFNETGRSFDADALVEALPGVTATIASIEPYDARTLAAATDLRIVARLGVGHDQVDVPACTAAGVAVAMAFGTNHEAVADHTLALMAALASRVTANDRRVREGAWGSLYHGTLHGTTVGLVGFGRIGRAVAKRCQGFAMRVLVHDPEVDAASIAHLGCEPAGFETLLETADIVSLHAPLMPATRHLIDAGALARMRPTAFLVNTARGPLIDEAALAAALERGTIAGAALDVFEVEPLPPASPLRRLDNVVLTPHVAGLSDAAVAAMAGKCVDNILDYLAGRALEPGLLLNPEVVGREAAGGAAADRPWQSK